MKMKKKKPMQKLQMGTKATLRMEARPAAHLEHFYGALCLPCPQLKNVAGVAAVQSLIHHWMTDVFSFKFVAEGVRELCLVPLNRDLE